MPPAIGANRDRQLFRHDQAQAARASHEVVPVAEVKVLRQRGCAPAARILDRRPSPDAGSAREIGEEATARAGRLLDEEVEVDGERLQAGEPRVPLVQVTPTRLSETDVRVVEHAERAAQEIPRRNEAGIEDCDEGRARQRQAVREGAGLEAVAGAAQHVGDADTALPPTCNAFVDDRERLVVRVVEDLHLEKITWPLQLAHRVEDALGYIPFVVDRYLHADSRLRSNGSRVIHARPQPGRAPGEVQKVRTESKQGNAGGGDDANRDRGDHWAAPSNNLYGRIVART